MITKYQLFCESLRVDMWNVIPQSVKDLQSIFKKSGYKLFVVGGAVRDFLISQKLDGDKVFAPKDFDLATDATPNDIIEILSLNNYKFSEIGKAFGVIMVYTNDQPEGMEIATFREDFYGDKLGITRNPDVKFSTIERDVERRDIPFNAMFYDLDKKQIIDLKGGAKDIEDKITRFVGDANLRIEEDPLRILRVIRFAARYQFNISEDTRQSILENKNKLKTITKERIWEEFKKGFKNAKVFTNYLQLVTDLDLWPQIFPTVKINTIIKPCDELEVYVAQILKDNSTADLERKMIQDFRIESDIATKVVFLINLLDLLPDNAFELYKQKIRCKCTPHTIIDWLDVNTITALRFIRFIDYVPSISAEDLMARGFKGKELGEEIKRLEKQKFIELVK
jgi:tRNA nucleotidyltransferase/poly(A) polymerase